MVLFGLPYRQEAPTGYWGPNKLSGKVSSMTFSANICPDYHHSYCEEVRIRALSVPSTMEGQDGEE